jgi:hypothetical protein
MIVQFFGLDSEYRNKIAKNFAKLHDAFFCTDRELPFASQESTYARWLRTIGSLLFKNNIKMFVASGFFPTKDSRIQFKDANEDNNIFTIWVDTMDIEDFIEPVVHHDAPTDFKWEQPTKDEYDLKIDDINKDVSNAISKILFAWDFKNEKYK